MYSNKLVYSPKGNYMSISISTTWRRRKFQIRSTSMIFGDPEMSLFNTHENAEQVMAFAFFMYGQLSGIFVWNVMNMSPTIMDIFQLYWFSNTTNKMRNWVFRTVGTLNSSCDVVSCSSIHVIFWKLVKLTGLTRVWYRLERSQYWPIYCGLLCPVSFLFSIVLVASWLYIAHRRLAHCSATIVRRRGYQTMLQCLVWSLGDWGCSPWTTCSSNASTYFTSTARVPGGVRPRLSTLRRYLGLLCQARYIQRDLHF